MSIIVSAEDSAARPAFLRDTFGRILDAKVLPPQTFMQAHSSVFSWVMYGPKPLPLGGARPACVDAHSFDHDYSPTLIEVYNFVRDNISEHMQTKPIPSGKVTAASRASDRYVLHCDVAGRLSVPALKINDAEARDMPKLAPTAGALKTIDAVCRHLHREYLARQGLEEISAVRTFREAAVEKIQSEPQLLSDWLQGAIQGVRQGIEPSDGVKSYGRRLLEIFEVSPDDYAARVSMPFIRDAVALYHEKAKTLVPYDAFDTRKTEILEMETRRAEVYLHKPHRSDYVATITELFGLGGQKFQRPLRRERQRCDPYPSHSYFCAVDDIC
ncbi:hypothetical protein AAVH_31589 [Aphelenchoides avenae]|nr:hypothetical protein AAVH_31589 [Aphelenchus avenae]